MDLRLNNSASYTRINFPDQYEQLVGELSLGNDQRTVKVVNQIQVYRTDLLNNLAWFTDIRYDTRFREFCQGNDHGTIEY